MKIFFIAMLVVGLFAAGCNPEKKGDTPSAPPIEHTAKLFSNKGSFALIKADGSVVSWGALALGGDSSREKENLNGTIRVIDIVPNRYSMTALREDGSVVSWGDVNNGGYSKDVFNNLAKKIPVKKIYATSTAYAALREDGSVVTWGQMGEGGDSSRVAHLIDGTIKVVNILSLYDGFVALREDGSVVSWGYNLVMSDEELEKLNGKKKIKEVMVLETMGFLVTFEDNTIHFVSHSSNGASINSKIALDFDGRLKAKKIVLGGHSFAILREDGAVFVYGKTWPTTSTGEFPAELKTALSNHNDAIVALAADKSPFESSYFALTESGMLIHWGFWSPTGTVWYAIRGKEFNAQNLQALGTDAYTSFLVDKKGNGQLIDHNTGEILVAESKIDGVIDPILRSYTSNFSDITTIHKNTIRHWNPNMFGMGVPREIKFEGNTIDVYTTVIGSWLGVTDTNKIYVWGRESGPSTLEDFRKALQEKSVDAQNKIISVKTTEYAIAALLADGQVIAWGPASHGGVLEQ